jgi:cAMP-dependent protein kinase regulator
MKPASGGILRALPGFRPLGDSSVAISPSVKRKGVTIIGNSPDVADAAAHGSLQRIVVNKTMDDKAFLVAALEANSLFAALSVQERTDIANAMELTTIPAGTTFIFEGDSGDALYAIELGKLDIIKKGSVVASWGDTPDRRIVGELALLYGVPHSASVRASTNVRAWRIKHSDFQMTMAAGNFQRLQHIADILKKGLLADLDADQLHRVAAACEVVSYQKGVKIISKGDRGDEFYVIESGKVICRNLPGELRDNSLTAGDYFGERSLLKDEPRICDIWAAEDTSLIVLHRKDFTSLLGSLRATLEHNVGMRLLLCVPLFARLSPDDLAAVFGKIRLLKFSKGSVILARGSSVTQILIIKEGRVEVKGVDQASPKAVEGLRNKVVKARSREVSPRLLDGVRVATSRPESARANDDILSEGQWFGEDEVDTAGPSPFTYTALEPVVAFSVDSDTYSLYLAPILRETRPSSAAATLGQKRDRVAKPIDGPLELPPPRKRLGIPLREFEQR